jgi:hypothetical protein
MDGSSALLIAATYASSERRTKALTTWLHSYNHHRVHTGLGQLISRLNNMCGHYI